MNQKLQDISEVISGYAFRSAVEPHSNGNIYLVQAKDISVGEPIVNSGVLTRVQFDVTGYSGYLQKNDILIVARGMKVGAFRATLFCANETNVIASSSVHVIRIKAANILPEYVVYYLNSQIGQAGLSEKISGSYIGALLLKDLKEIKIPLPSLEAQHKVIGLYENIEAQKKLLERKQQIHLNIINSVFQNLTVG